MGLTTIIAKQQGCEDGPPMVFLFCNTSMMPLACGGFDTIAEADAFVAWLTEEWHGADPRSIAGPDVAAGREEWIGYDRPGYDPGEDPDR